MKPRPFASIHLLGAAVFAGMLAAPFTGCAPRDEREPVAAPIAPAMAIDPVDMPELPEWFTNGSITIEFKDTGLYRMYAGMNRHAKPIERGRWVRVNYASVSLEPYATGRNATPVRGTLDKHDDELVLRLPKAKPLLALAGPPMVIEDELFGTWVNDGAGESLELRPNMRFVFKRENGERTPAALSGITGAWHVEGQHLILQPDASSIEPMEYAIKREDEKLSLEVNGSALRPK